MDRTFRAAIVRNGAVDHIEMVGPGYRAPPGAKAIATDTANIGDHYDGEKFVPQEKPTEPPDLAKAVDLLREGRTRLRYLVDVGAGLKAVTDLRGPSRDDLAMLERWGLANPTGLRAWHDDHGNRVILTGAQFVSLSQSVSTAILDLFEKADELLTDIHSDKRTVWTEEDILKAFNAILPPLA